jgi:hypothetical protein
MQNYIVLNFRLLYKDNLQVLRAKFKVLEKFFVSVDLTLTVW